MCGHFACMSCDMSCVMSRDRAVVGLAGGRGEVGRVRQQGTTVGLQAV